MSAALHQIFRDGRVQPKLTAKKDRSTDGISASLTPSLPTGGKKEAHQNNASKTRRIDFQLENMARVKQKQVPHGQFSSCRNSLWL